MKWWKRQRSIADPDFRCKSFMLELLVAYLFDEGLDGADYPAALEQIFTYIVRTGLRDRIAFTDFYPSSKLPINDEAPMRIYDPVNEENNVVHRYSILDRERIVAAAQDALEAVAYARYATTKATAIEQWRRVFGPSFEA